MLRGGLRGGETQDRPVRDKAAAERELTAAELEAAGQQRLPPLSRGQAARSLKSLSAGITSVINIPAGGP